MVAALSRANVHGMADYSPEADGQPDPGEVCWAWVPYEEDASQGKSDRCSYRGPRRRRRGGGDHVVARRMTRNDHDRDAAQEAAAGRHWMDVGAGDWDRERRPSEARLRPLLRLDVADVRREGAALDAGIYAEVLAARAALG